MLTCPSCESTHLSKNGRIHNGKENHKCRSWGHRFVEQTKQKNHPYAKVPLSVV